jgi:hypothetical protein
VVVTKADLTTFIRIIEFQVDELYVILVQYNVDNRSWAYLLTVTQIATKVEGYLPSGREIRFKGFHVVLCLVALTH